MISVRDGPTVYHTGDTDVFGDMQLLRRFLPGTPSQFAAALGARGLESRFQPLRIGETVEL